MAEAGQVHRGAGCDWERFLVRAQALIWRGSVWKVDKCLRVYLAKTCVTKGRRDWKDCQDPRAQQWWRRSQLPGTGNTQPPVQAGRCQQHLTSKNVSCAPGVVSTSIQISNLNRTIFHIYFRGGYQSLCKYSILTDLRNLWGLYWYTRFSNRVIEGRKCCLHFLKAMSGGTAGGIKNPNSVLLTQVYK